MEHFLAKLGKDLTWEEKVSAIRVKTMVNGQFAIHPLAKRMKEIVQGKVKLRPEYWKRPGLLLSVNLAGPHGLRRVWGVVTDPGRKGRVNQR